MSSYEPSQFDAQSSVPTPVDIAELALVEAELDKRWPETKIEPSLTRIEALMDVLGSPQHNYPSVHVTGTNGKTSVTRMIDSLMTALHRRTGRTTSLICRSRPSGSASTVIRSRRGSTWTRSARSSRTCR